MLKLHIIYNETVTKIVPERCKLEQYVLTIKISKSIEKRDSSCYKQSLDTKNES